jgi:MFS transporter, Spinster family, sphingosine-1-phosphate transporter
MSPDRYRSYLLGMLLVVLAFNLVDRLALGLVLQSIKTDLALTDTELGLLSGLAFALFYSVMGIPIARWADRGDRVLIISMTIAIWSVMVILSGFAVTFWQLLAIRIGVAIGEAGCVPPAYSLIGDYFTREERPRAVAIYMLGGPLSVLIGFCMAGWINQAYGWRITFMVLGVPGLVLAALTRFTLREQRRARSASIAPDQANGWTVFTTLWRNATYRHLLLCFSVSSFFSSGIVQWQATFFIRSYGLSTGTLGIWLAVIYGLGGALGTYWGGAWAACYAKDNEPLQLKAMAWAFCAFSAISILIYLCHNAYVGFALMGVAMIGGTSINGPLFATIQTLVPAHLRAISIAIIYLFSNFIGLGLGPLAAGALSDAIRSVAGEESLRYALLILSPGYVWAAWHLWRASRTVARDVQRAQMLEPVPMTHLAIST